MTERKLVKFTNQKKLIILSMIGIVCFFFFLFIYYKPRSYEKEYIIDAYKILEKYYKKEKTYYYLLTKGEEQIEFVLPIKYTPNRKLVNEIKESNGCLNISYLKKKNKEICQISESNKVLKEYEKTKVYDNTIRALVWNYNSIIILNKNEYKKMDLFDHDTYDNFLMTVIDNYLFLPNYANKYETNEIYLINLKTYKKELIKLKYTLSYDSYILGNYKNNIYIVDKKNNLEYTFNIKKKELKIISKTNGYGLIYDNGLKNVEMNKLIKNNLEFKYNNIYHYQMEDNKLYLNYLDSEIIHFICDVENGSIVKKDNDKIYYIIDDILFRYTPDKGIQKIMEKFEWNFNNNNVVFIY